MGTELTNREPPLTKIGKTRGVAGLSQASSEFGKDKRRILAVIRWPVGGIRTWCKDVYTHPAFGAFDIELIMPRDRDGAADALYEDLRGTSISVTRTAESMRSFASHLAKRLLSTRRELVHSHGFTSAVLSHPLVRLKGVPHLITPHDVVLDGQQRGILGTLRRTAVARALRSADRVQAVSIAAASNLVTAFPRAFRDGRHLQVVNNGIETSRLDVEPQTDLRESLEIEADTILVGFFGRFMSQKGFKYLVDAVGQHPIDNSGNKRLMVVAVGSGGFRREEEAHLAAIGLADRFRFLDFVPDIAGLLKAVDVVAMPSQWEACGLLAMEAMAAGTPLVVSDCEALVEIARGSPVSVVPRTDAKALLRAILDQSRPGAKQEARDYAATAQERFDVAHARDGIFKLYSELTSRS